MITFSIITITYQAEAVLEKTVESVLEQQYAYVEHLIIDGASKDRTVAIAEAYKERSDAADNGHSVLITSEPDKGLYDAMNKGLVKATGDYVVFLNAGDFLPSPHTLETVAACVGEGEELPAVLYGETDIVDSNYQFLRHRRLKVPKVLTWRSFRQGMLVCHQSFYVRRDLALAIPYDLRYRFSADVDWCVRLLKYVERRRLPVVNTHEILTDYLSEGMTTKNHRASLLERWRVMQHHYGWWQTLAMHLWFAVRAVYLR